MGQGTGWEMTLLELYGRVPFPGNSKQLPQLPLTHQSSMGGGHSRKA